MPACCSCMSNGRCVRCSCVREGHACIDCWPSRQNPKRCENLADRDPNNEPSIQADTALEAQLLTVSTTITCLSPAPCSQLLPVYKQMSTTAFTWGALDGPSVAHAIDQAYVEIIHWQRNVFQLPSGKAGKDFIREQTRLFSYTKGKPLKRIALNTTMTMPALLLQKPVPHPRPRTMQNVSKDVCAFGLLVTLMASC